DDESSNKDSNNCENENDIEFNKNEKQISQDEDIDYSDTEYEDSLNNSSENECDSIQELFT
ncbi:28096_t:CDS:1, partial [Racocetra persica]